MFLQNEVVQIKLLSEQAMNESQVTDEQVDAYFKPLAEDEELHLPQGAVHAYARL